MTIYLANAATSWPKPEAVYGAVDHFMREVGATPDRGGHRREEEALRIADEARQALAQLFSAPDPQGVAFTMNAMQAINMSPKGLLRAGDHVVTSSIEHNAVWRPLKALEQQGVEVTAVPCAPDGTLNPDDVETALRPDTRLVAMLHTSNVLGTILPIGHVGHICQDRGILFLVDAAQTAGAYPIDMEAMGIDLLAFAGHKGTYGPHGPGGLVVRPGIELETWVEDRLCGCKPQAEDYGTWRGHPREPIPWFPTIAEDLCNGCGACLDFCSFGVLRATDDDKSSAGGALQVPGGMQLMRQRLPAAGDHVPAAERAGYVSARGR